MSTEQEAQPAGPRRLQIKLSTLLLLAPLLALVCALGSWVQSLRHQVQSLEKRVSAIELQNKVLTLLSSRRVPESVDRAMLMDGLNSTQGFDAPGSSMPMLRR